jgi:hypothetical protein
MPGSRLLFGCWPGFMLGSFEHTYDLAAVLPSGTCLEFQTLERCEMWVWRQLTSRPNATVKWPRWALPFKLTRRGLRPGNLRERRFWITSCGRSTAHSLLISLRVPNFRPGRPLVWIRDLSGVRIEGTRAWGPKLRGVNRSPKVLRGPYLERVRHQWVLLVAKHQGHP